MTRIRRAATLAALLALSCLAAFAQPSGCAAMFPQATLTPDIYWAHQPPAVQALRDMPNGPERVAAAGKLAAQGYVIDAPIMANDWDAVCAMGYRQLWGFTWVPSALQPAVAAPGISNPPAGFATYDPTKPPAGSIVVSMDAKDYPPFNPPQLPAPKPVGTNLIGQCYGSVCNPGPGVAAAHLTDGQGVTDGGQRYIYHLTQTPFGSTSWFEKVQ